VSAAPRLISALFEREVIPNKASTRVSTRQTQVFAPRRIGLALLAASSCFAQFPGEQERLMATARLWVTVEYFHPYVAYRDIDWDQALLTAIPKIRAAKEDAEYQAALSGMLAEVHDPETHLLPGELPPASPPTMQWTLLRSAQSTSFVGGVLPAQRTVVELPGLRAVVRLSEPFTTVPALRPAKPEPADPYPSPALRLLAAIKTWGAIHYFFAYKDLMDEDWDDLFAPYLQKFIEAKDAIDYNLALADLLTQLTDSHSAVHSKTLDTYFGESSVGLRIRLLDRYPIVTDVLDPSAKAAGIQPGDVVKRVAGVSTTDIFRRFVQYIPASTPQRSGYDTIQKVTSGPANSEVELTVENADGEAHAVKLTRTGLPRAQRTTEPIRILAGNIGYLDLDRLSLQEADKAMEQLQNTRALIFDLRGQAPAASAIAGHLTAQTNVAAALVTTPLALHPDIASDGIATQTASTFVVRTLPPPSQPRYQGKTLALIDERTIGESEYAGLLFEAANKTEFVGAPSAGAVSGVAELPLPGGITVTYSTEDIRHANGGKLQRLGLQPNIAAPTTAKGLRVGKDEALEAALSALAILK
jgi:C-terminal processing protease CtpA/Prc